ncbi:MAG TPA: pyridoxal-dependent decarboxylase [Candidatus Kapabacteria bacterium]|nr:pyridoxal-dependent decarboxylase [Candidatus Kapabacteria bacterium]
MDRHDSRLQLSTDEMRALGYRVVDMVIEHLETLGERPVSTVATRAELDATIGRAIPSAPRAIADVLDAIERDVMGNIAHVDHPRFFAYVPSPGNFVGAMAEALVAGFNVFAGAWPVASGPSYVELAVIDWLRGLCGLPTAAGGVLVSGGSTANLTALIVARDGLSEHERERAVIYCSDQTHSSIARALDVIGLSAERRRVVSKRRFGSGAGPGAASGAASGDGAIDLVELARLIESDRAAGLHPWWVVANAGSTSIGACDDLSGLHDICHRDGVAMWMHVDAAYGGGALLSARGRERLAGIEHADSVTLDPHKWLFQPFDIGCVLVRDAALLERSFESIPAYLRDSSGTGEVNFRDRGIELTRPFRALKLWMTLQIFGTDALSSGVERGMHAAALAADILATSPWWILEPTGGEWIGIVVFRHAQLAVSSGSSDDSHRRLARLLVDDGYAMLSTTEVDGRVCLRLCTINARTSDDDIRNTITRLEELAATITP